MLPTHGRTSASLPTYLAPPPKCKSITSDIGFVVCLQQYCLLPPVSAARFLRHQPSYPDPLLTAAKPTSSGCPLPQSKCQQRVFDSPDDIHLPHVCRLVRLSSLYIILVLMMLFQVRTLASDIPSLTQWHEEQESYF